MAIHPHHSFALRTSCVILALTFAGCAGDRHRPFGAGDRSVNSTLGKDSRERPRGRMEPPSAPGVDIVRAPRDVQTTPVSLPAR